MSVERAHFPLIGVENKGSGIHTTPLAVAVTRLVSPAASIVSWMNGRSVCCAERSGSVRWASLSHCVKKLVVGAELVPI